MTGCVQISDTRFQALVSIQAGYPIRDQSIQWNEKRSETAPVVWKRRLEFLSSPRLWRGPPRGPGTYAILGRLFWAGGCHSEQNSLFFFVFLTAIMRLFSLPNFNAAVDLVFFLPPFSFSFSFFCHKQTPGGGRNFQPRPFGREGGGGGGFGRGRSSYRGFNQPPRPWGLASKYVMKNI